MNKEFIPYEEALALKELGFDEPCFSHYNNGDLITKTAILKSSTMLYYQQNNINPNNQYKHQNCTAPLYQQAFRWFREKYDLCGIALPFGEGLFDYRIYSAKDGKHLFGSPEFNIYEEAELECLKKLIEIVKSK